MWDLVLLGLMLPSLGQRILDLVDYKGQNGCDAECVITRHARVVIFLNLILGTGGTNLHPRLQCAGRGGSTFSSPALVLTKIPPFLAPLLFLGEKSCLWEGAFHLELCMDGRIKPPLLAWCILHLCI